MIIWRILPVIVVVHIATTPCGRKLEEVYNNSTTTYSCCAPLIARITLVYNDSELNRANESARHISRNQTGSPSEGNCEKVTIPNLKMNNNTVVVCFFQNLVGCHGKTNITHIVNGPSPKTRNMVLNISSAGTTSPSSDAKSGGSAAKIVVGFVAGILVPIVLVITVLVIVVVALYCCSKNRHHRGNGSLMNRIESEPEPRHRKPTEVDTESLPKMNEEVTQGISSMTRLHAYKPKTMAPQRSNSRDVNTTSEDKELQSSPVTPLSNINEIYINTDLQMATSDTKQLHQPHEPIGSPTIVAIEPHHPLNPAEIQGSSKHESYAISHCQVIN